jgi:FHS family L-fucose permease-like MFS transporter
MRILYVVGVYFLLAAALFYFSKKITGRTSDSSFENGKQKAMKTLIAITVVLVVIFAYIFQCEDPIAIYR